MTSLLWATHLTSKGFKLVLLGPNLSKLDHTCSNWFKVEQTYLDLHKLVSNLHKRCIFIYYEPPLTQNGWTMTSDWPRGCEAALFVVREDPFVAFLSFDQIWLKFAQKVHLYILWTSIDSKWLNYDLGLTSRLWGRTFCGEGGPICGIPQFWSDLAQICPKGVFFNIINFHNLRMGDLWPQGGLEAVRLPLLW